MKTIFVIIIIFALNLLAGSKDNANGPEPSWQQSESLNILLGVRDKNASMEYYDAIFKVIDEQEKNVYEATIRVEADGWGFLNFPEDFSVYALDGNYTWKCFVKDMLVSAGSFTLGDDQRTLTLPKK